MVPNLLTDKSGLGMHYCLNCDKETYNEKFCSHSCQQKYACNLKGYCGFKKGYTPWNKGLKKLRKAWNKLPERKIKCEVCGKEKMISGSKQRLNQKFCSIECKRKSQIGKKTWNLGLTKENDIRIKNYGLKDSIAFVELWKDPEFAKKVFHRRNKSKPEIIFEKLIEDNNFPYYFNGYLQNENPLIIGGKIPDFPHNIERKVIEIWGNYWHRNDNPQDRINFFKQYGYDCLIIWEDELKDTSKILCLVEKFTDINKIKFMEGAGCQIGR